MLSRRICRAALGVALALAIAGPASAQLPPQMNLNGGLAQHTVVGSVVAAPYFTSAAGVFTAILVTNTLPTDAVMHLHVIDGDAGSNWGEQDIYCGMTPNETTLVLFQDTGAGPRMKTECSNVGRAFAGAPPDAIVDFQDGTVEDLLVAGQRGMLVITEVLVTDEAATITANNRFISDWTTVDLPMGTAISSQALHFQSPGQVGVNGAGIVFGGAFPAVLGVDFLAPTPGGEIVTELLLVTLDGHPGTPPRQAVDGWVYNDDEVKESWQERQWECMDLFALTDLDPNFTSTELCTAAPLGCVGHVVLNPTVVSVGDSIHDAPFNVFAGALNPGFRQSVFDGWIIHRFNNGGALAGLGPIANPAATVRLLNRGPSSNTPLPGDLFGLDLRGGSVSDFPPTAVDDVATVLEDAVAPTIDVLTNDTDPDGGPKLIDTVTQPANGTVVITGGGSGLTYQPNTNYCNDPPGIMTDDFTYTLTPGGSTATVAVTVTCVNDAPTFTAADPPTVLEDAGAQVVGGWVTSFTRGPASEAAQTVAGYTVSNVTNGALFSTPPAVSTAGVLTYTPAANASGTSMFDVVVQDSGGTANGGVDTSTPVQTFTITVTPVNDPPSFTKGPDETVMEDAGPQLVMPWATALSKGPANESGQTLSFNITANTNMALFSTQPSVNALGQLSYEPAANANGSAMITLNIMDDGGGTDTSPTQTFMITVTAVDDPPVAVNDARTLTEDDPATPINPLGNDTDPDGGPKLVTAVSDPVGGTTAITGGGTGIDYTPDPNFCNDPPGTTTDDFTYTITGGSMATVAVTVTCVNDPPSFTKGADETVLEDVGGVGVAGWASGLSAGPANESGQTLSFNITANTNPTLFSSGPSVNPAGDLSYTPVANGSGTAMITLNIMDDGGGTDTSPTQTFSITITDVNDAPSFVAVNPPNGTEDTLGSVAAWAAFTAGPSPFEDTQTATYTVSNVVPTNNAVGGGALFTTGPAVSPTGTLTYTLAPNAHGSATFDVKVTDSGGTANGGVNMSGTQNFTLTIVPVNDPPTAAANPPVGGYKALSNVQISFAAANGLLAASADHPSEGTIVSIDGVSTRTTTQGGDVVINLTTGAFTYDPPAGYVGPDDFTFTVTDSGTPLPPATSAAATVNLTVDGPTIWFVDNDDPTAGGDGRLSNPFQCLVGAGCFSAVAADAPGDFIFLADRTTGTYAPGLVLLNTQGLIGDGSSSTLAAITSAAPPAGSDPLPTFSGTDPVISGAGDGITLGSANLVRGLTVGTTAGFGITGGAVGTFNILETSVNGSGGALQIATSGTTGTVSFDELSSTSSTTQGLRLVGVSGTISVATGSLSGATGDAVQISGSSLSLSYPGSITNTAANAVDVSSSGGSLLDFAGAITDTGAGILLANPGTITFRGGLDLDTGASTAFSATGGGTVNVCDTVDCAAGVAVVNTADTTTATAVKINGTTIGPNGVTFLSVSASGGTSPGIELVSTGSGSFTVAGDGATGAGLTANNGSGGTITNMTSDCVLLDTVTNVSLNYMDITDCDDNGVDGADVNGFVLTRSNVTGHADGGSTEAPLFFRGLTGTADGTGELSGGTHPTLIANSLIADGDEDNIQIKNETGTLARLEVRDSTIGSTTFGPVADRRNSNDGINFEGLSTGAGNAVMNLRVKDSIFIGHGGDHVNPFHNGTGGSMDVDILTNTMTDSQSNPVGVGGGITIAANDSTAGSGAALTYDVAGNTIEDAILVAIDTNLVISGAAMVMKGKIRDNIIGRTGAGITECGSGSSTGVPIRVRSNRAGTHTVSITGNTLRNWTNGGGIQIQVRDGTGTLNATVTGNTEVLDAGCIAGFLVFGSGLFLETGAVGTDTTTLCIDAGGAGALSNTLVDPNGFDPSIVVLQNFAGTTMRFPTYAGAATNPTAHTDLNTFLGGRNSLGANGVAADPGVGPTFQGGIAAGVSGGAPSTCPQP